MDKVFWMRNEKWNRLDYLRARMIAYEFHKQSKEKNMQITMQGKYQTKEGRPVRILCVDRKGSECSVIGLVVFPDGSESVNFWTLEGKCWTSNGPNAADLIPVPERQPVVHQMWAVMKSNDEISYSSYSKQDAELHCNLFARETVRLIQWNTWES